MFFITSFFSHDHKTHIFTLYQIRARRKFLSHFWKIVALPCMCCNIVTWNKLMPLYDTICSEWNYEKRYHQSMLAKVSSLFCSMGIMRDRLLLHECRKYFTICCFVWSLNQWIMTRVRRGNIDWLKWIKWTAAIAFYGNLQYRAALENVLKLHNRQIPSI